MRCASGRPYAGPTGLVGRRNAGSRPLTTTCVTRHSARVPSKRPVAAARERVRERVACGREQQVTGLGDAATDDEASGVEDRGQVGHALPEPAPDLVETVDRGGVALLCRAGDDRPVDGVDVTA